MDYRGSGLRSDLIPELHQAIIPSYRFTCCGNITEWGVDVDPAGGRNDRIYNLDLQVWRPSPTTQTTGCYSLVGNNRFTSVSLDFGVAIVTPLPQAIIEFQPGDVLGFNLENTVGNDGGVVLLMDSAEQGDNGYETEEVWHADVTDLTFVNAECLFFVGSQPGSDLNTYISAAPIISVEYSKSISACYCQYTLPHNIVLYINSRIIGSTQCPPNIMPTVAPSQPMLTETNPVTSPDKVTDSMLDQTGTEGNPLNNSSDTLGNTGLIVGIVAAALMVITVVILTEVLSFIIIYKKQKKEVSTVTNMAYGTALHNTAVNTEGDTYDYPSMDNQTKSSIDTKINEAYATNAEVKPCIAYGTSAEARPCVAYATNITTERNVAYGIQLHDVVTCREGDAYDYPTMDS